MSNTLIIQLVVSFAAGGLLVTLLALLAEKTHENISGIIMMFPTTIVLGFFFLGLATSAAQVAAVVPATLIPVGMIPLTAAIYIYFSGAFATRLKTRSQQIIATFVCSSFTWLLMAMPFALYKPQSIWLGALGYTLVAGLAHYLLNKEQTIKKAERPAYTKTQIVFRAVFTGSIIAIVVLLGKVLDPFWGGVFTMYPAATFATLIILHFYYEPAQLCFFMKKLPLGSILIFLYAVSSMVFFPRYGLVAGSACAYAVCLLASAVLIRYQQQRAQLNKV